MLSKTSIYAIRAMVRLAEGREKYAGAVSIAKEIGAPRNYLGKMLQLLSQVGLLQSQKGFGGGFCLARDPHQITLFDVVEPIEQIQRKAGCMLGKPHCSAEDPCVMHVQWKAVRDHYLHFLETTTIGDLLVHSHQRPEEAGKPPSVEG